jgi:hypothetical protein
MKALEMLRARKNNSVTTVTSEKNAVVTAQPLINKAVTSYFDDADLEVTVNVCIECDFFHPDDKYNPYQGLGRCKLGIIRKDRPLHPMQEACDKSKPLTPF